MSGKEKAKRLRAIGEFDESVQFALQQSESAAAQKQSRQGDIENQSSINRGDSNLEEKSTKQLQLEQRKMLKNQESQLEEIFGVTTAIKYEGQNIDTELREQQPIINSLKDEIDRNQIKMVKLDSRLKTLVAQTSPCKLMMLIFCEFFVLILLVLMM